MTAEIFTRPPRRQAHAPFAYEGRQLYQLQAFWYECRRVVRYDEHPRDIINLLIDGYKAVMAMLPVVDRWRVPAEYDIVTDFATDQTIVKIRSRGWIRQRSDGTEWVLP